MSRQARSFVLIVIVAAASGAAGSALAAAASTAARPPAHKHAKKKIRMNEPMTNKMMKPGMMKGDVKNAADRKAEEMQPMMEQEEKAMPKDGGQR